MEETEKPAFEPMPEHPAEQQERTAERTAAELHAEALTEARRNVLYGLLWCAAGLAISFFSYYITEAGGRYVVATGAILWGAVRALRGFYDWLQLVRAAGNTAAVPRMVAAAVCTVALIGALTVYSMRSVRSQGIELLDTEQTYVCDRIGLRLAIPAGFSALQQEEEPETDSTYFRTFLFVSDGTWEFNVEAYADALSPEARTVADLAAYCSHRDSSYYDGGIIDPSHLRTVGGREMLYSAGRRTEYPDDVFTCYDLKQGQSLITVGIIYPAAQHGTEATRQRIEELLGGIELAAAPAAPES